MTKLIVQATLRNDDGTEATGEIEMNFPDQVANKNLDEHVHVFLVGFKQSVEMISSMKPTPLATHGPRVNRRQRPI
jgi:hypothetical protein